MPKRIIFKGAARAALKEGLQRPNGFMGIGLESERYNSNHLPYYVDWMAQKLQSSTFYIGDVCCQVNAAVFGVRIPEKRGKEKYQEVEECIGRCGDRTRMSVIMESSIPSQEILKRLTHRKKELERYLSASIRNNTASRLDDMVERGHGYWDTVERLWGYPLTAVAATLGILREYDVSIKVGFVSERIYDKIVYRTLQGDYNDDPVLKDFSNDGKEWFGSVYFSFSTDQTG